MKARSGAGILARQVAATFFLLAAYLLARRAPVPGVNPAALAESPLRTEGNLLALGLTPWIFGWLLVEALSLLPGPGRRLRRGGAAGRRKLDRFAPPLGILFAVVQGIGMAAGFEGSYTRVGVPLVADPGWRFRSVLIASFLAVSVALFWLARLLSRYGLGNGFSLLLLTEMIVSVAGAGSAEALSLGPREIALQLAAGLAVAALLFLYLRGVERSRLPAREPARGASGSAAPGTRWAVSFPQSVFPVALAGFFLVPLLGTRELGSPFGFRLDARLWFNAWIAGQCLLVTLFSGLLHRLFCGRRRLTAELPVPAGEAARRTAELSRRFLPSTALLLAGSAGLAVWNHLHPGPWSVLCDIVRLTLLFAVLADLASQARFTLREGPAAVLVELNNVHLAPLLAERLAAAGVPATLRGFRHRALGFAFLSLVRIGVLVPAEKLEAARRVLAGLDVQVF